MFTIIIIIIIFGKC